MASLKFEEYPYANQDSHFYLKNESLKIPL